MISRLTSSPSSGGVDVPLTQSWSYYVGAGSPGPNSTSGGAPVTPVGPASGAYVFIPLNDTAVPVAPPPGAATVHIVAGPVVSEARMVVAGTWVTQVVRLWANASYVEVSYTVGPVPVKADGLSKEVVTRYTVPGWDNAGPVPNGTNARARQWATDSNCRDMIVRTQDARDYTPFLPTSPVSGNYYPVNCALQTWDASSGTALTILTDRTHAGTGMFPGAVELLVHRRELQDDSFGVMEALDEPGLSAGDAGLVVRGVHRIVVASLPATPALTKRVQQEAAFPLRPTFAGLGGVSPSAWAAAYRPLFTGLGAAPLPPALHLATLHVWAPTRVLLRLAHLFDARDAAFMGADPAVVGNATVDLAALLALPAGVTLLSATELTSTATTPLASVPKVAYAVDGRGAGDALVMPVVPPPPAGVAASVTLSPMQVRTFMLEYSGPVGRA